MLYIRIELWPHGDKKRRRLLHEGTIANIGGTDDMGEYEAKFGSVSPPTMALGPLELGAQVSDFPRLQLTAWDLLYRCLRDAFGHRNQ